MTTIALPVLCTGELKTVFLHMQNQRRRSTCSNVKLISALVFTTRIVQSLYFLNKFKASSHLLWLYNLVFVSPWSETPKTGFLLTLLIYFPTLPVIPPIWVHILIVILVSFPRLLPLIRIPIPMMSFSIFSTYGHF